MSIIPDLTTSEGLIELLNATCDQNARPYSGRGMFGEECVGIAYDDEKAGLILELFDSFVRILIDSGELKKAAEVDLYLVTFTRLMGRAKEDDLGRGIIVYWPQMEWPEDMQEDEDDDE